MDYNVVKREMNVAGWGEQLMDSLLELKMKSRNCSRMSWTSDYNIYRSFEMFGVNAHFRGQVQGVIMGLLAN